MQTFLHYHSIPPFLWCLRVSTHYYHFRIKIWHVARQYHDVDKLVAPLLQFDIFFIYLKNMYIDANDTSLKPWLQCSIAWRIYLNLHNVSLLDVTFSLISQNLLEYMLSVRTSLVVLTFPAPSIIKTIHQKRSKHLLGSIKLSLLSSLQNWFCVIPWCCTLHCFFVITYPC